MSDNMEHDEPPVEPVKTNEALMPRDKAGEPVPTPGAAPQSGWTGRRVVQQAVPLWPEPNPEFEQDVEWPASEVSFEPVVDAAAAPVAAAYSWPEPAVVPAVEPQPVAAPRAGVAPFWARSEPVVEPVPVPVVAEPVVDAAVAAESSRPEPEAAVAPAPDAAVQPAVQPAGEEDEADDAKAYLTDLGLLLRPAFSAMIDRIPKIRYAVLCTPDGFNVCSTGVGNEQIGKMAAISSSLLVVGEALVTAATGNTDLDILTMESQGMQIVSTRVTAGGRSIILLICARTPLGVILVNVKAAVPQLRTLMELLTS
jgi:predicted regulator of Ras-like GTPase activity (Roadblock/LC7/MglB family)